MERICPDAWLLNYTNPMTMLVRAVTKTSRIRCLGMCHELFGLFMHLSKVLKLRNWRNFEARTFGINHFVWATDIRYRGRDVTGRIRDHIKKHGTKGNLQVKLELFRLYGALPVAGDRHVVEFMGHFCNERTNAGADFGVKLTSIEERLRWLRDGKKLVADMTSGRKKISLRQSPERVSNIIVALSGGEREIDIINLPNRGQMDNLPRESVVEGMALIDASGTHPLAVGKIPPPIQALLNLHIQKQEMTVEAALAGDRDLALQALLIDPLVQDWKTAPAMLDEMLEANRKYLPQFFK
jgi:alpha-galactosidase